MKFVKFWSLFAVSLFVISGFAGIYGASVPSLSGLGSTSNSAAHYLAGLDAKAQSEVSRLGPSYQADLSSLQSGGIAALTNQELQATAESLLGPYASVATRLTAQDYSGVRAALEGNSEPLLAADGGYYSTSYIISGLITAGAICLVGGVESLGTVCVAAIAAVLLIPIIESLVCGVAGALGINIGCSSSDSIAQSAALGEAQQIVGDIAYAANVQAEGLSNLINVFNSTEAALGYEAAWAARNQLPNATFNYALDGAQSGVSQQVASVFYGDAVAIATMVNVAQSREAYYEVATNTLGYVCALGLVDGTALEPTNEGTSCPSATTDSPVNLEGAAYGGVTIPTATACSSVVHTYFLQNGDPIQVTFAGTSLSGQLTLIPVDGSAWQNITIPADISTGGTVATNYTLDIPYGGQNGMDYRVCSADSSVNAISVDYTLPADNASAAAIFGSLNGGPQVYSIETPGTGDAITASSSGPPYLTVAVSGGNVPIAGYWGGNPGNEYAISTVSYSAVQANLVQYLVTMQSVAETMGATYWAFLRYDLGITNKANIPANCEIPSPSQLLPPNIPISELETLNASTLLTIYQAALLSLGHTFGPYGLNASSICGIHPTWNYNNTSEAFGVYAFGYIYIAGAGVDNSNGTAAQTFANPETWNVSGEIFISPTTANLATIPLNQRFLLPINQAVIAFAEPFVQNGSGQVVNATGPTYCAPYGADRGTAGCGLSVQDESIYWGLYGNSTAGGGYTGSIYPTDKSVGAASAVYLTACYTAVNGTSATNPQFIATNTCSFGEQRINNTYDPCQSGYTRENVIIGGVDYGTCTKTTGTGVLLGATTCGIGGILGTIVGDVATVFQIFGNTIACDIAWVVLLIVGIVLVYAVVRVIVSATRRRGGE